MGNDALFRGLMALSNAVGELGKVGASLVITPELVTAPLRVSQPQQPALAGAAPAAAAASSSSSSGEGAAASEPQAEVGQAAAMVQVVHLYITKPRKGQQAEAKGAQDGKRQEAAGTAEAAASPAAPVAASAPAAGPGEITVPLSEWEALKGAVGDMMQQQKVLTNLLVAQQQQQQLQGQVQQ